MLTAYLVLLYEFFREFSIFHFRRPLVDIYWHPLLYPEFAEEQANGDWNLKSIKVSMFLKFELF